ncbi:MAG TPA: M23 family metallopeptidase [Campylobacteraceae bacterium]|nr:M23 family metallopeptidase [Campylobacteraceae bacterium]
MYRRHNSKYLLYTSLFLAGTLVLVALFSLYFSDKTAVIKQQEMVLAHKYRTLQQKIAQKEAEYRRLNDSIDDIKAQIGLRGEAQHADIGALLQKCTPRIQHLMLGALPVGYPSLTHRITSGYGFRVHPIYHEERFHHGIDFGGKEGTPIHATQDGIVLFSGFSRGGYGNMVIIAHDYGFSTLYGHMLPDLRVKTGDFVRKGETIGFLGNSGLSTGPHLHYEIKYLNKSVDPAPFLHARAGSAFATLLRQSPKIAWQSLIAAVTTAYKRFTSL